MPHTKQQRDPTQQDIRNYFKLQNAAVHHRKRKRNEENEECELSLKEPCTKRVKIDAAYVDKTIQALRTFISSIARAKRYENQDALVGFFLSDEGFIMLLTVLKQYIIN